MIDLVFWSFVVAFLPMVLALAASMMAGAAGALGRPAARRDAWDRPQHLRFRPTTPPAFGHARLGRSGDRFYDL